MGMLFGLLVLILVVAGLLYRRKQNKAWVSEERNDESGDWLDKRAGERGTYGSLDAEREKTSRQRAHQGRVMELARLWRDYAFDQYSGFSDLSDAQLKSFTTFARTTAEQFLQSVEALLQGKVADNVEPVAPDEHIQALKKIALDFAYTHFPKLLDLDVDQLRQFDLLTQGRVKTLIDKIGSLAGNKA